jgi:putative dehydrogenase
MTDTSNISAVIGLVGLGAMGSGMAQSLRRAGHAPH